MYRLPDLLITQELIPSFNVESVTKSSVWPDLCYSLITLTFYVAVVFSYTLYKGLRESQNFYFRFSLCSYVATSHLGVNNSLILSLISTKLDQAIFRVKISVVERNFTIHNSRTKVARKLNHLHKISDTQTTFDTKILKKL